MGREKGKGKRRADREIGGKVERERKRRKGT